MVRPLRLAALGLLPLLVLLAAAYAAGWFYLAGRVRGEIEDWAAARRSAGLTVGWDRYAIGGFPLALRVTVERPVLADPTAAPGYEARAPLLVGNARPWSPDDWRLALPEGASLTVQPGPERPALAVSAAALTGRLAPADRLGAPPGRALTLTADRIAAIMVDRIAIAHAELHTRIRDRPAPSHLATWLTAEIDLAGIRLATAVVPLGTTIDRLATSLAVKDTIPPGPRRQALAAWRDDGGTIELRALTLAWGPLAVAASGTLALDADMQPIGALSATIAGYDGIIDALIVRHAIRPNDGALAKLALGLIAKKRPDGTPELGAPITLQDGALFLGPARLVRLPRFTWE